MLMFFFVELSIIVGSSVFFVCFFVELSILVGTNGYKYSVGGKPP